MPSHTHFTDRQFHFQHHEYLPADMETLECEPRQVDGVFMESYVAVRPAGGAEGNFRFVLSGSEKLKLAFQINKVLQGPEFEGMTAELELSTLARRADQDREKLSGHHLVGPRGPR